MAQPIRIRNVNTGQFKQGIPTKTIDVLNTFAKRVVSSGRQILTKQGKRTKSDELYKDFNYNLNFNGNSFTLKFDFGRANKYYRFVNDGVRGAQTSKGRAMRSPFKFTNKQPPLKPIMNWINNKPIKLRNARGQFIEKNQKNIKSVAFLIARNIRLVGIPYTGFYTRPFEKQYKKLPKDVNKSFALDLSKLLEQALPKTITT